MEYVNKNYLKLSRISINEQMLKAYENDNIEALTYFEELNKIIIIYEKESHNLIGEIYVKVEEFPDKLKEKATIKRETLINTYTYANFIDDFDIAKQIRNNLYKPEVTLDELGVLKDYILQNSTQLEKLFTPQKRYIFSLSDNSIISDYIYNTTDNIKNEEKVKNHIRN